MQYNNFLTKIADKRRRKKATSKSNHRHDHDHTESTATSDKRVRFSGRDSVTVYDEPKRPQHNSEPDIDTRSLWYNKKELNEQFLKDLESQLQEQIRRTQSVSSNSDSDSSSDKTSGRGLEIHMLHNQRRREKAGAYVRHIVEKSYEIRKEALRQRKLPKLGSRKQHSASLRHPATMHRFADEIGEYASQYTWMSRDLAIGVAAEDEAQARAVYQEDNSNDEGNTSIASTDNTSVTSTDKESSSEFTPVACRHSKTQAPRSYTAKSA